MATRNPRQTRERLLQTAFQEIHAHGFQGMRVDEVLRQSKLQKGAFYHHFNSKTELAYAVLEEQIKPLLESIWIEPLEQIEDPTRDLPAMLAILGDRIPPSILKYGCPLNNLAQEMAPLDSGFRDRISEVFDSWTEALADVFEQAKHKGFVDVNADSRAIASFTIAALEGCIGIFKIRQSTEHWHACQSQITAYLETLRPA
ncbi:MAG: TetR/AcrR family transcriptional regulator [Candidatus Thiodiazotropha sp. L084R]